MSAGFRWVLCTAVVMSVTGCGDTEPDTGNGIERCFETTLDLSICDPETAEFSLQSTNPYYPLVVGLETALEGIEDDVLIRVERRVLPDIEDVAGVKTHVLEAREYVNGQLFEVARNFYVEASDGTVCYFGEDVTFYEDGAVLNHEGSWRAGVDGAEPGIIMPADPAVGDAYFQENAPGVARDMGRVSRVGFSETIDGTEYDDLVEVMDANPIDDEDPCQQEQKLYIPGLGEAADTVKRLVSFLLPD